MNFRVMSAPFPSVSPFRHVVDVDFRITICNEVATLAAGNKNRPEHLC
jgi:hypothetical protein